jgi:hypothetical protein
LLGYFLVLFSCFSSFFPSFSDVTGGSILHSPATPCPVGRPPRPSARATWVACRAVRGRGRCRRRWDRSDYETTMGIYGMLWSIDRSYRDKYIGIIGI